MTTMRTKWVGLLFWVKMYVNVLSRTELRSLLRRCDARWSDSVIYTLMIKTSKCGMPIMPYVRKYVS